MKLSSSEQKYYKGRKKYLHLKKKSRWNFSNRKNLLFCQNRNFIKVNLPTHIRLRRNCQLFLILTHWISLKRKDILHTLNVYKIPAKEHQVNHQWAADEISVS